MVDFSQLKLMTSSTTNLAPSNAGETVLVPVSLTSLPDKLGDLSRAVQLTGIIATDSTDGNLLLRTAVGDIQLSLSSALLDTQSSLPQQIANTTQNQRVVTLLIQAGLPPTQGILQLPTTAASAQTALPFQDPVGPLSLPNNQPSTKTENTITTGTTLKALVVGGQANTAASAATSRSPLSPIAANLYAKTSGNLPQVLRDGTASASNAIIIPKMNMPVLLRTEPSSILGKAEVLAEKILASKMMHDLDLPENMTDKTDFKTSEVLKETTHPRAIQTNDEKSFLAKTDFQNNARANKNASDISVRTNVNLEKTGLSGDNKSSDPAKNLNESFAIVGKGPLPTGLRVLLTVKAIELPEAVTPLPSPDNKTTQVVAKVMGCGPQGQLLLNDGNNGFYVKHAGNLPVGTKVLLEIAKPTDNDAGLGNEGRNDRTALQEALHALQEIDPAVAKQVALANIPQTTHHLAGSLIFLISALNKNGSGASLGEEAMDRLERNGKHHLAKAVTDENAESVSSVRDPLIGSWRSFQIPLMDPSQIHMMKLFVRDEDNGRKEDRATKQNNDYKTRFLINLNPTRLGAMQLDGLVGKKKFDMVIRSEKTLPNNLPHELRELYIKTLGAFDYAGTITFQTGRQSWVVMEQAKKEKGILT